MALNIGGPHRGHAAGNTDVEKQASQLASDVKLKVKKEMGPHTNMNPAQVAQAYLRKLASSPAPGPVKALARKKLSVGVKEEYGIGDLAKQSAVNALLKVFVEGVSVEEVEDIVESDEKKYWIVVTDKKTGNTYRRQATRAKIAELRSNPNIRRVEMTGYHPKETDDKQGRKTSKVKSGQGLDPVGKEDADVNNNDIKNDKSDKYLLTRRAAVGNAILSRGTQKEEFIGEAKKTKKTKTKDSTITGEGVNNSKYINLKPTMEQTTVVANPNQQQTPTQQKPNQDPALEAKKKQKIMLQKKIETDKINQLNKGIPLTQSYDPEGESIEEVAPPGFENTIKAMKNHPELSKGKTPKGKKKNIYALAWYMKNKGYKSHRTASGAMKEDADCGCDEKPKIKKSKGGKVSPEEIKINSNLAKNELRSMGLNMSHEPKGEVVNEGPEDRVNDERLMRGGVGAGRGSSRMTTGSSKPYDRKTTAKNNKEVVDLVRQSIIAKHGKDALM